jgi:hypothetical protein
MRELGPDEGINRLQHPDCRACDERERVNVGIIADLQGRILIDRSGVGEDVDLSEALKGLAERIR